MSEMAGWGFYGRRRERAELARVLGRGRWFFLQISGRRRIGKTRLLQELLQPERQKRVLYIQIPDSDPAGVVSTARDFMETFGVSAPFPQDLRSLAVRIGELCAAGWIVALDEPSQRLRLGSCKRSEQALVNDLTNSGAISSRPGKAWREPHRARSSA
jgi:hypothetical protein